MTQQVGRRWTYSSTIEQLAGLRSIPNLNILRPADQTETIECWDSFKNEKLPSILALTRQNLKPLEIILQKKINALWSLRGLKNWKKIKFILLASGSEVNLLSKLVKFGQTKNIQK